MAETTSLKDLISELKGQNNLSNVRLTQIGEHTRNSRRHLLEMKKSLFRMEEMVQILANPPETPNDSLDEEERREKKARDEKMIAALEKIAKGTGSGRAAAAARSGSGFGLGDMLKGAGIGALAATALKSAGGLVAMGVAIPAFFGGLLAGDAALSWMESIGADFDFNALKRAALGFSDMILAMDPQSFVVLGGIMAASAVGGTRAAKGVGAMGFAISAFLGGLIAGNTLIAGAEWIGADLNFAAMKKAMVGFSDIILGLKPEAQVALAGLIMIGGGGALLGKNPTTVGTGVAALGAGIAGFFLGLSVGDAAMSWLGADYTGIAAATAGFSAAIDNLSPSAMVTLAGLLGAGALLGAVTDERTKLKMVSGIAALSAGIAAFFTGFAAMDAAAKQLGEGSSAKTLVQNFSDAIGSLDETSMTTLGTLFAAGGALGALFGIGAAANAAIGITAIGAGIAGFFLAFDGLATVANVIGVDGSKAKILLTNFAAGMRELGTINGDNLLKVVPAMGLLGPAMLALMGSNGLAGLAGTVTDGVKSAWAWITGEDETSGTPRNRFAEVAEMIRPLQDVDGTKLDGFSTAVSRLAEFVALDFGSSADDFSRFAQSLGRNIPALETAVFGGSDGVIFRTQIRGLASSGLEYEQAARNISVLRDSLNNMSTGAGAGGGGTVINNFYGTNGGGGQNGTVVVGDEGSPHPNRNPVQDEFVISP